MARRRRRRKSRLPIPVFVVLLLLGAWYGWWRQPATSEAPPPALTAEAPDGTVLAVADGDTMTLMLAGKKEKVRLHGVDAPESDQPFGREATDFATRLLLNRPVTVRTHERDRYGRLIGEIFLEDGSSFNVLLVEEGMAWWYRQYGKGRDDLKQAEERARAKRLGLWRAHDPIAPWDWRARQRKGSPAPEPALTP